MSSSLYLEVHCIAISVSVSDRTHISKTICPNFTKFSLLVVRGRNSVPPLTTVQYVMCFRFCRDVIFFITGRIPQSRLQRMYTYFRLTSRMSIGFLRILECSHAGQLCRLVQRQQIALLFSCIQSTCPVRAPRRNAPLIRFLITALYCLLVIGYRMLPHLSFFLHFSLLIFSLTYLYLFP